MNNKKFRIGKIHISRTNPTDAIKSITDAALSGNGGYICVSNMRMVMYANKNAKYAQVMDDSFMNLPDGTPLSWCGRFWGLKDVEKTCGPDLFVAMLKNGDKNIKHYLLGDTQDVIDEITRKYRDELGANIVGGESLPFASVDEFDYAGIAKRVKDSGANVVWTAMRAPKQDEFNRILFDYLPNVVSLGVGRAFRISIGMVGNPPKWAVKLGLGGLFMLRTSIFSEIFWYINAELHLLYYFMQITCRRIVGKKYYE